MWGAGHLIKNDRMIFSGPYAYLRHPLYAGSALIGVGFICMAGGWATWLVLPPTLLVFFIYYYPYKERIESARLERCYGAPYVAYRAAVSGLWPRLRPWSPASHEMGAGASPSHWSLARMRDNDEDGVALAVSLGAGLLFLWSLLWT